MAKICRVCKEIKEIEDFTIDKNYASGRNTQCKACHSKYNRKYTVSRRKENRKPSEYITVEKKYCNECFEEKNINEYSKCHANSDGHLGKCRECCRISARARRHNRINSHANKEFIFCNKCYKEKNYRDFAGSGLSRVKPICKQCWNTNFKLKNKSISQVCHLSHEDYNKLLEKQNFVCAICKKPETRILRGYPARLVVDHCHKSEEKGINKIRGLLCNKCNSGLGWFQDSISNLKEAIIYLESQN